MAETAFWVPHCRWHRHDYTGHGSMQHQKTSSLAMPTNCISKSMFFQQTRGPIRLPVSVSSLRSDVTMPRLRCCEIWPGALGGSRTKKQHVQQKCSHTCVHVFTYIIPGFSDSEIRSSDIGLLQIRIVRICEFSDSRFSGFSFFQLAVHLRMCPGARRSARY